MMRNLRERVALRLAPWLYTPEQAYRKSTKTLEDLNDWNRETARIAEDWPAARTTVHRY